MHVDKSLNHCPITALEKMREAEKAAFELHENKFCAQVFQCECI